MTPVAPLTKYDCNKIQTYLLLLFFHHLSQGSITKGNMQLFAITMEHHNGIETLFLSWRNLLTHSKCFTTLVFLLSLSLPSLKDTRFSSL